MLLVPTETIRNERKIVPALYGTAVRTASSLHCYLRIPRPPLHSTVLVPLLLLPDVAVAMARDTWYLVSLSVIACQDRLTAPSYCFTYTTYIHTKYTYMLLLLYDKSIHKPLYCSNQLPGENAEAVSSCSISERYKMCTKSTPTRPDLWAVGKSCKRSRG